MKKNFLLLILISLAICLEDIEYTGTIKFLSSSVESEGSGFTAIGSTVSLEKAGSYLVTGLNNEGNLIIKTNSVEVYLKNILLGSSTTAPITVNSHLTGVKIVAVENVILNNKEDENSTGECAVIKVKKQSEVTIENLKSFTLTGTCKNVIKGGEQTSIIFGNSEGTYTIDAEKNGIVSDGYLEFNGGVFNIDTRSGDAVKSSPDDTDTDSLGRILVNDGSFTINSYSDAFTAKNNITIVKGKFTIKTENGYQSSTFNSDSQSAKGFKVTNNDKGSEIYVHSAEMTFNTADDAFHSNGNLTIVSGKVQIHSKNDALHAGFNLILGKQEGPLEDLFLNILYSYEALEGMTIRIYSGKINCTATDDGINAAGSGSDSQNPWGGGNPGHGGPGGQRPGPGGGGNSSYYVAIHGGEVNVFCDGDGIDSNGNIFFHGGVVNVFSQGNRDNEPIDHDGSFTLFDTDVLCAGSKGMEQIHSGILKGNMMYAYYSSAVTKDKTIKVKNESGEVVREGRITKDINYMFYSSPNLNKNYKFYLVEDNGSETQYTFTFGNPTSGTDDELK